MDTEKIIAWAKAAGMRAMKTAAQVALGAIGAAALVTDVDWAAVGLTVALSVITSILTSIAGLPEVEGGTSPLLMTAGEADYDESDEEDA